MIVERIDLSSFKVTLEADELNELVSLAEQRKMSLEDIIGYLIETAMDII